MKRSASLVLSILALSVGLVSCETSDETEPAPAAEMPSPPSMLPMGPADGLPPAPAAGEWIEVAPGGETTCARDTPYLFFVRGGDPDKVIIDFQGGGACWNELSCSIAGALFKEEATPLSVFEQAIIEGRLTGIFSDDEENPFADWTLIHVQYCTGDIHWGDAVVDYREGLTINHKGYVNARSAVDWFNARYQPSEVLVSGCSAGAYGAIMHSALIARDQPDIKMRVIADSGAGVITDSFLNDSLPGWGAEQHIPSFIPDLQVPITELSLPDLYLGVAAHYPEHRFAQLTSNFDADQTFFWQAMGGDPAEWPQRMRQSIGRIEDGAPNFRSYITPGSMHCMLPYPFLYTREVDGVSLSEWMTDFVFADEAPPSVRCEGEGCFDDPVCAACAEDPSSGGWCRFCDGWPDRYRPPAEEPPAEEE